MLTICNGKEISPVRYKFVLQSLDAMASCPRNGRRLASIILDDGGLNV